jgi:spermidine synthase
MLAGAHEIRCMARRPSPRHRPPRRAGFALLVAVMFAVSGAAALVDQFVWTRWLTLVLGSTTRAAVVVLSVFMGGLGLGAWIAGRLADRMPRRSLTLFAGAEALVAGWTFLSIPLLSSWLPGWAATLARDGDAAALPLGLRILLAAGALVLPTFLMGTTLPLLARWAVTAGGLPGRDIGDLYGVNTLGGAAGALLAAFVLVDRWGLSGAVAAAGLADLAVALVAAAIVFRTRGVAALATPSPAQRPVAPPAPVGRLLLVAAALGFGVSGFVGLGLEVVAHRVIAVIAGSSTYAFAVMLAGFLVGIAIGSTVGARRADRVRRPGVALGWTLSGLAVGTGLAERLFAAGAWQAFGRWASALPGLSGWSYGFELLGCLLTLLPATLMLGFAVPLVGRIAGEAPEHLAGRFGAAYALNTLGAMAGAIVVGQALIPAIGTSGSILALSALAGLAGLLVVAVAAPPSARVRALALAAALAIVGVMLGVAADPVRDSLLGRTDPERVLAFDEGPVQTIALIEEDNFQQRRFLRLITNRTSLTGTHLYAQRYMRLLGHLPALYAPAPERGLVICLGTGMTAAAAAAHPDLERLDIVEISPAVARLSDLFEEVNDAVLDDPRTRLHIEDGRHVLLAATGRWSFVTLEPPPPRDSGVVSLYSTDFYALARERLVAGGTVAQWIPLHSQSAAEVRMLVRSFVDQFPHVLAFLPVERDLILIGSEWPLARDPAVLAARMGAPGVADSLAAIGFEDPAALLATAVADRERLARWTGAGPLVTDDRPRVEYFANYGKRPALPAVEQLLEDPLPLERLVTGPIPEDLQRSFARDRAALRALLEGAWLYERQQAPLAARRQLESLRLRPNDPFLRWANQLSDEHLRDLEQRAEQAGTPAAWRKLASAFTARGEYRSAAKGYERALELAPDDPETLRRLGDLLLGPLGQEELGRRMLVRAIRLDPGHPAVPEIRRRLGRQP